MPEDFEYPTKTEKMILDVIALKRETYGYEIVKELKKCFGKSMSIGTLYPTLKRMEKKGYLDSKWGDEENDLGARRKFYSLNGYGARVLDAVRAAEQAFSGVLPEGLEPNNAS